MIDKYNYPNDSPNECCKNFLKNMDFVPSGTFFKCPTCANRIDMLECNKFTKR